MSKHHHQATLAQIERLESAVLYRFARRLLDMATSGHVKTTMPHLIEIYGRSQGSVHQALIKLKKSTIIDYRTYGDSCYISFCTWAQDGAS